MAVPSGASNEVSFEDSHVVEYALVRLLQLDGCDLKLGD